MTNSEVDISKALRLTDIEALLPQMSRVTLWRLRKTEGFPRSFQIMGIDYWHPQEIQNWIAEISRPKAA